MRLLLKYYMLMKKGVFLDRDGTIIRDVVYLSDPKRIEFFEESYEAIKRLNDKDFLVFIVTNQSGVARGFVTEEMVRHLNMLVIDDVKSHGALILDAAYCPHPVAGGCQCRKPNPGMILELSRKHDIDLKNSWMVGDRMSDVLAGENAGARGILLQNETTPPVGESIPTPKFISKNILTAADFIIADALKRNAK
jgi:D-glycero-D-manno-heptose 1,7-bisphosphate phosphatase